MPVSGVDSITYAGRRDGVAVIDVRGTLLLNGSMSCGAGPESKVARAAFCLHYSSPYAVLSGRRTLRAQRASSTRSIAVALTFPMWIHSPMTGPIWVSPPNWSSLAT